MNILVTNYDNSGEDVMIIIDPDSGLALSVTTVIAALTQVGKAFTDVYEVPDKDLRYYLFDPLFADAEFVSKMQEAAAKCPDDACRAAMDAIGFAR